MSDELERSTELSEKSEEAAGAEQAAYFNKLAEEAEASKETQGAYNAEKAQQIGQQERMYQDAGYQGKVKKPKQKKKGGLFKKLVAAFLIAVVFGAASAGSFYGVIRATGVLKELQDYNSKVTSPSIPVQTPIGNSQKLDNTVSTDISEVVEQVMPAMVTILNSSSEETYFWGQTYTKEYQSTGSGIIIGQNDEELLVATNHHVAEGAKKLEITFIDGESCEARVKGMDADMDLAVLAVRFQDMKDTTVSAITVATLGSSDDLKLGKPVIVIGNALGHGLSVTDGIISGLNREVTFEDGSVGNLVQTNAAVNQGNSGGAMLNINGEVIGIVSSKMGGYGVEGMGYAIPISAANPIIADLMERQTRGDKVADAERGYLGISLQEITSEAISYYHMPAGVFISEVTEGSGAQKAGLLRGDIITKAEGEKITSYADLQNVLQYYKQGDEFQITISRSENGEYVTHEYTVTLGERPE